MAAREIQAASQATTKCYWHCKHHSVKRGKSGHYRTTVKAPFATGGENASATDNAQQTHTTQ